MLGTEVIGSTRSEVRQSGMFGALAQVFDRQIRFVLIGLVTLIVLSTAYFHLDGSGWMTSLYRALTASTDTGLDVEDLSMSFRFGAVAIQLFGLILSSGITAVIIDALISSRLAVRLKARGVAVVAIEHREDAIGVLRARQLKIPVVVAAASDPSAQEVAGIARAYAVLAVTDDEAVNLEIGLLAKAANPGVRVVSRLFDHDLASRVERRLDLGASRSVSMLAAPAFAAAALGRRREVIFPIGRRVLLFTEVTVHAGSGGPGTPLGALTQPGACTVLAHRAADTGRWDWEPDEVLLGAGEQVAVAATRAGLARTLLATKRNRPPRPDEVD